ncbi:MAG: DUF885 family protein, partial [Planktotalea arctica]
MSGIFEAKLAELGVTLPSAPAPAANYVPFVQVGELVHVSGQISMGPDGSRPGVFYSHMSDMSTLPIFQLEDVAYHEGSPGHHMQISIQQELEDVPRFRTQYRTTAYT